MAEIAKSGKPSISTIMPDGAQRIAGDLYAGEIIDAGDACYINANGKVYRCLADAVPTVAATGGGSTGGLLAAGTYYGRYSLTRTRTLTNPNSPWTQTQTEESGASGESAQFTVSAGDIPRITFPAGAPPTGYTYNLYLTPANGASGSEVLYASGITTATYDAAVAAPGGAAPPYVNSIGASRVHGFAPTSANPGDAVALYFDVNFKYGSGLTPGIPVYLSAIVPGGLADSAPASGRLPVGFVVDATRIRLWQSYD